MVNTGDPTLGIV